MPGLFSYKTICKLPVAWLPVVLLLLTVAPLHAQVTDSTVIKTNDTAVARVDNITRKDSILYYTKPPKKRFWRAAGELMLVQVIPWSVNYFIRDADFAHISWQSISYNLDLSHWEWDDNKFTTNQFAHPYQGNLYFNSFRTNGFNFWQSAPAAFAGSFMWEVAGETHPGAPNDFINTSFGGISLGEMTYRMANLIVNEKQRGFKRQMQEIAALVINPVNGFNRILDGKWGRVNRTPNPLRDSVKLHGQVDAGWRRFSSEINNLFTKGKNEWYARFSLLYGDPYRDFKKPFDNFALVAEIGNDDSSKINIVHVAGGLAGWHLHTSEKQKWIANITLNYDFYKNASFFWSGQSANFTVLSDLTLGPKVHLYTQTGVGAIILAATPDDYLYYGEGRNYDYGPGISLLGAARLSLFNHFATALNYRGGWSFTVNGNKSNFFLNAVTWDARYNFLKNFTASLELGQFTLNSNYRDKTDVDHRYPHFRLALGVLF